jgi:hypothetical protein
VASFATGPDDFSVSISAADLMVDVQSLAETIGARPMGSDGERLAGEYVANRFTGMGYPVQVQEFVTTPPQREGMPASGPVTSRNIIATKPGDAKILVIGAHMDSPAVGVGAGDNASGVAAMLGVAQALQDVQLVHTVVFVAFGAEEGGSPSGAEFYIQSLGDQINNVVAMLNIDAVGIGDALNVYAGAEVTWPTPIDPTPIIHPGPTWVRDLALNVAGTMGQPLRTSPAETWKGFTGDWSDHYAFVMANVPVAYFEAWQWDTGDPWWGQETAVGDVMKTTGDVYGAIKPAQVESAAEIIAATAASIANDTAL